MASYPTRNGTKTSEELRAELMAAGYGGPWDDASMLAAYERAGGGGGGTGGSGGTAGVVNAIGQSNREYFEEGVRQYNQDYELRKRELEDAILRGANADEIARRQQAVNEALYQLNVAKAKSDFVLGLLTNDTNRQQNALSYLQNMRQQDLSFAQTLLNTATELGSRPADHFKFQQYTSGGKNLWQQLTGAQPTAGFQAPTGPIRSGGINELLQQLGIRGVAPAAGVNPNATTSAEQVAPYRQLFGDTSAPGVGGVGGGTPATPTSPTTPATPASPAFNGDDYAAIATIAMARPDIFGVIGKDTGWLQKGETLDPNALTDADYEVDANTTGAQASAYKPLLIQRMVEEWVRMGSKAGVNDPSTTPYGGDFQKIAAQLVAGLTDEQRAKAATLANTLRGIDYLAYKLTDNGQYNSFADWANKYGQEHWGGSFDTIENARKSVIAWAKGQRFNQQNVNPNLQTPWGSQDWHIADIAKGMGYQDTMKPEDYQFANLYKGTDQTPISSYLWLNFNRSGAGTQPWMSKYTRPYMRKSQYTPAA